MIRLEQFINVIHEAVLSANGTLFEENRKLFNIYFEESTEQEGLQDDVEEALDRIETVIKEQKGDKDAMADTLEVFKQARKVFKGKERLNYLTEQKGSLRSRTVALQFPQQTEEGVVMKEVNVPVITLIPLAMAKVSEVKFISELEIQVENNDVLINFPFRARKEKDETAVSSNGNIEITITPQENSEGLKRLIEGYEKVLKGQLPI